MMVIGVNLALTVCAHPIDVSYLTAGIRVSKKLGTETHSQSTQPHARLPAMAQQPPNIKKE